jgi:hypothetical protein
MNSYNPVAHHKEKIMLYYIFNTEQEALAAEQQIVDNVRQWVAANVPDALSEDGTKLRGRNAKTGEFVDAYTTRWAVPQQIVDGRWVFAKPTQEKTSPIPAEVFTANIVADEVPYDENWFATDETLLPE